MGRLADSGSIFDLMQLVPDEASAVAYIERRFWGDEPRCPRCVSTPSCSGC